jgi:branched-chain amino acid transport system permease protein
VRSGLLGAPAALLAATVLALVGAGALGDYDLDLGVTLLVYLATAQAWNILAGFGGQVSLGTAAFVGTGGYAAGLLMLHSGAGWELGLLAAGAAAGALGLVLSIPLLRLRGDYFTVGTLAAAVALQALANNWQWAGGASGITVPFEKVPVGEGLFRVAVVVAAVSMAVAVCVVRSRFGLRLMAVRDNESAAVGLGVSAYRHRLAALLISSVLTGFAGAVLAFQTAAIAPDGIFGIGLSINALLMAIVGGAGTIGGPVVGVLVVYYGLTKQFEDAQTLSIVIEGALLIAIVRFAPMGLWPLARRGAQLLLKHPTPSSRAAPTATGAVVAATEDAPAVEGSLDTEIV